MKLEGERRRNRTARLEAIRRYLYQKGLQGATVKELANHCEIHRSHIYGDLRDLEKDGEPIYQEGSRWFLDRELYVNRIRITLNESVAVFLAARLLTKQSDKHNPHIVNALDKLSMALLPMHPIVGAHIHQAANSVRQRPTEAAYVKVFEIFARAWSDQCCVEVEYLSTRHPDWERRTIAPYYLEVSGIGFSTYIIGHDSKSNAIRTFKLERVATARLRPFDTFVIPETFDPQDRLGNAWGVIWPAEGEEPTEVRLLFSPAVVRRVKESIWHPSQVTEDLPDGWCRYIVRVGSTKEMRPWVRGWGKDVIVESPPAFRQEIAEELRAAMAQYE